MSDKELVKETNLILNELGREVAISQIFLHNTKELYFLLEKPNARLLVRDYPIIKNRLSILWKHLEKARKTAQLLSKILETTQGEIKEMESEKEFLFEPSEERVPELCEILLELKGILEHEQEETRKRRTGTGGEHTEPTSGD